MIWMRAVAAAARSAVAGSLAALLGGCVSETLPPSIWPPPDFSLVVEELRFQAQHAHVVRRVRFDADGLVVYGESSQHLVDAATGTSLPVFDRLAVYRLEPDCVRALARRLYRLGVTDVQVGADESGGAAATGVVLTWQAFDERRILPGQGRLRGAFGEILAVVGAHLPPGEAFETAIHRPIVPVLRGVPEPGEGAAEALAAYEGLRGEGVDDPAVLLDGFALACSLGQRAAAQRWLADWTASTEAERRRTPVFPDGSPRLGPEVLATFLP